MVFAKKKYPESWGDKKYRQQEISIQYDEIWGDEKSKR
ncbi:MAG: hypothetical protein CM15mV127_190 [Caudoviricetes sp.]|nr:MAG: hypothetical protein CM15mV127_190 [Caudoviricetes sp.]